MANFWGTLPPQIFFSSGGNVWYLVAICGSVTGGGGNISHSPEWDYFSQMECPTLRIRRMIIILRS